MNKLWEWTYKDVGRTETAILYDPMEARYEAWN